MSTTAPTVTVEIDFTTNLSAGFSYSERVLSDGPYAYYQLRETSGTVATDASGNGVTGTYGGTYTQNQTSGKPVTGDTASRYVLFGGDGTSPGRVSFTGTVPAADQATVEAWIYQDTLAGDDFYPIFDNSGSTADAAAFAFQLYPTGKLRVYVGSGWVTTSASVITAGSWFHVAATIDTPNQEIVIYVNGSAVTVDTTNMLTGGMHTLSLVDTSWRWGYNVAAPNASAIDRIAEGAVYLRALSATEVLSHYEARTVVPFAGYTWTDVTDYLLVNPGLSRRFGRESSLEEVAPMETAYTLVNDDRRFEVGNSASPYYPNVVPGRPTRVRMTQDAVTYDWAFGFIEDFPQDWDPSGLFGRVSIVAHDSLARMNQHTIQKRRFLEQASGARMQATANVAGIPESMRAIDAGVEDVMEQTIESGSAGDHARKVAQTDRGLLYFDGRGWMVFQDGSYRTLNARATVARGLLGPSGSVDIVTLGAPVFHAPAALIFNEITLRRPGGVDQVAVDATSRSKYGPRSHQDELLLPTDSAIAARAAALLADYKDPTLRVEAIRFNPARAPGQWDHALGVQPSDRYTWVFAPQQGSSVTRDVFVEGIADVWSGSEYVATWFLSLFPVVPVVSGSFRGLLALTS